MLFGKSGDTMTNILLDMKTTKEILGYLNSCSLKVSWFGERSVVCQKGNTTTSMLFQDVIDELKGKPVSQEILNKVEEISDEIKEKNIFLRTMVKVRDWWISYNIYKELFQLACMKVSSERNDEESELGRKSRSSERFEDFPPRNSFSLELPYKKEESVDIEPSNAKVSFGSLEQAAPNFVNLLKGFFDKASGGYNITEKKKGDITITFQKGFRLLVPIDDDRLKIKAVVYCFEQVVEITSEENKFSLKGISTFAHPKLPSKIIKSPINSIVIGMNRNTFHTETKKGPLTFNSKEHNLEKYAEKLKSDSKKVLAKESLKNVLNEYHKNYLNASRAS